MPFTLGPNTAAPSGLLSHKVIVCAGEDADELHRCALKLWPHIAPPAAFTYRCFQFRRWPGQTIIWTGIGTGCLEPLLWEILQPGIVSDIILIGTAGRLFNSRLPIRVAGVVTEAYSGCTSIDDVAGETPLAPHYSIPTHLPAGSIVSTDYYYGFSGRTLDSTYPASTALRLAVERHMATRDWVDMETAQFYYFCKTLGPPTLKYLSVRAAANDITSQDEQLTHTPNALYECLKLAVKLQDGQA